MTQRLEVGETNRPAVIFRAGRLPLADGREQGIGSDGAGRDMEAGAAGSDLDLARPPNGASRDHQVFGCASKADEQVMIVGVDRGCPPGEIRNDVDGRGRGPEAPRLRIVAVGRKRGVADHVPDARLVGCRPEALAIVLIVRHRADCPRPAEAARSYQQQRAAAKGQGSSVHARSLGLQRASPIAVPRMTIARFERRAFTGTTTPLLAAPLLEDRPSDAHPCGW